MLIPIRSVDIFQDDFTGQTEEICENIARLAEDSKEPITLLINSYGALGIAQDRIMAVMKHSECTFNGVVTGRAFSAAFNLLQYCKHRSAYPSAKLLFHAPRITAEMASMITTFPAEEDYVLGEDEEYLLSLQSLAERSKQPFEKLKEWGSEEMCFSAEEALQYGFIDEIVPAG